MAKKTVKNVQGIVITKKSGETPGGRRYISDHYKHPDGTSRQVTMVDRSLPSGQFEKVSKGRFGSEKFEVNRGTRTPIKKGPTTKVKK